MKTRALLLLVFLLALYGCINSSANKSVVSVINKSPYGIMVGSLDIGGQKFEISTLDLNGIIHFNYTPRSDCQYLIKIKFSSGKTLEKSIGYITSGLNYDDTLMITDSDIILEKRKVF